MCRFVINRGFTSWQYCSILKSISYQIHKNNKSHVIQKIIDTVSIDLGQKQH